MDSHFDLQDHDQEHQHHHDQDSHETAEALIASLKAVINHPSGHSETHEGEGEASIPIGQIENHDQSQPTLHTYTGEQDQQSTPVNSAIKRSLASLTHLTTAHQGLLDELNSPNAIHQLAANLRALKEGNKRQIEVIKDLTAQFKASEMGIDLSEPFHDQIDPELSPVVLRSEYDALKSQYDALAAVVPSSTPTTSSGKRTARKGRASRAVAMPAAEVDQLSSAEQKEQMQSGDRRTPSGGYEGRKKRSIKLEHLVHKMANRRLGVEYAVSNYESKGSKDLPDPTSAPLGAAESPNGVDEFRPIFAGDVNGSNAKPFVEKVVDDVWEAWQNGQGDSGDMDKEKIHGAMTIYWTRLIKRWDEQQCRERGEIHRDELSRRKQNQYRRQQSLLMRRTTNFDYSPLNSCRLRALYRTLLTIDFAAPTADQPDNKRAYTPEEWYAYRRLSCGARANEAHEVVDQFWMSSTVRSLLIILDEFSQEQTARAKRKGKPKQPNPTFHFPHQLWDRSTLPTIRPKDSDGLPLTGTNGIVLFRFHVDEQVQRENPEWAKNLYDNPPIPAEDDHLPSLSALLSQPIYTSLRQSAHDAKERATPRSLTMEQVEHINSGMDLSLLEGVVIGGGGSTGENNPPPGLDGEGEYMTFAALSQLTNPGESESQIGDAPGIPGGPPTYVPITSLPIPLPAAPTGSSSTPPLSLTFPDHHPLSTANRIGTSSQARKLGKRNASEMPGGAATPVAKRQRSVLMIGDSLGDELAHGDEEDGEVQEVLGRDAAFLEMI